MTHTYKSEIFDVEIVKRPFLHNLPGGGICSFVQKLHLRRRYKGGILIEFTFCIPVCITLLFFVNDHYRFYELKSKIRTSAYLAASMLQQIGNSCTDKQLTMKDVKNISYASCLNFFHTKSMFNPWPFGIFYCAHFFYVKRLNSNSYQYQITYGSTAESSTSPGTMYMGSASSRQVTTKTRAQVEDLYPDLICQNDGEERVLVNCVYRRGYGYGCPGASPFKKDQLGFFIMNPPDFKTVAGCGGNICHYNLVITPKPGLFPVRE